LLEPQSTWFFLLMMLAFGAMVWWLSVTKQVVFRVLAACLAFVPAMMFGIAAVNKYYDYYQSWDAAFADITNQGVPSAGPPAAGHGSAGGFSRFLGNTIDTQLAAQQGFTLHLTVHGLVSNVSRSVYVYLPRQYFSAAYRTYRFPVIELLHGFPGQPQNWFTVLDITTTLQKLVSEGRAKPVVLLMPDANGGRGISLQCLNQVHGPQDATFLARDLPAYISRVLRVQRPGRSWGIAGYSEGGFCAANLGLRYSGNYGYAAVLSGYFQPGQNQLGNPPRLVSPFGGNKRLQRMNTPGDLLQSLPPGTRIPQFWLGAGSDDRLGVRDAEIFNQQLQLRQPAAALRLVPHGGHTMFTWRMLVPPMLEWMTPRLAYQAVAANRAQRAAAARAARGQQAAHAPQAGHTPKAGTTPKAAGTRKTARGTAAAKKRRTRHKRT
jgi:enterochelin esterase-like enzyme